MTANNCKLVILLSGNGSNLQSFIDCIKSGSLSAEIVAVFSNRPDAIGLKRAANANIPSQAINHTDFNSREDFDAKLMQRIDHYAPDLVILAGFMRILTPAFVQHFQGRLLNIHPSLLPNYPGLNTHQRAIDAGDEAAGATVHFVTEQLDGGPAIVQAPIVIKADETAETLAKNVLIKEHKIYPMAAQWFAEGRLKLEGKSALLDNKKLPSNGYQFSH
jgi:phosphoribosylglycinamide formyltransferase-1